MLPLPSIKIIFFNFILCALIIDGSISIPMERERERERGRKKEQPMKSFVCGKFSELLYKIQSQLSTELD